MLINCYENALLLLSQLPFRHFMLTSRGYVKLDDETPLNPAKLRSVSLRAASRKALPL